MLRSGDCPWGSQVTLVGFTRAEYLSRPPFAPLINVIITQLNPFLGGSQTYQIILLALLTLVLVIGKSLGSPHLSVLITFL